MISSSTTVQYAIELQAAGYVDGSRSNLTIFQRLESLRNHNNGWNRLIWSRSDSYKINLGPHHSTLYDLFGGVLARGTQTEITFVQLPSSIRGTDARQFSYAFEFPLSDISIDPDQDLMILVQQRDHRLVEVS